MIGLWKLMASPGLEDLRRRQDGAFHRLAVGQRILIQDGVSSRRRSCPATDLGRDAEVQEVGFGGGGQTEPNKAVVTPALTISIFNLKHDKPIAVAVSISMFSRSFGGFVLEMGDTAQHASFEALRQAHAEQPAHNRMERRASGGFRRVLAVATSWRQPSRRTSRSRRKSTCREPQGVQEHAIRTASQWAVALSAAGPRARLGHTGRRGPAGKQDGTVCTEPGRKAYLLAESGERRGGRLQFAARCAILERGVGSRPDGKVVLLRVEYRPWAAEYEVDYGRTPSNPAPTWPKS